MRILLVHPDKYRWATTIRAEELKKRWVNDQVDIAYFRRLPPGDNYDVIHFLFSGGIGKIKDYILRYKSKTFTTLASPRTLTEYYDKLPVLIEIYTSTLACVCNSPELVSQLKVLTKQNNAVYIPNGVDTQVFNRPFIVGFVGAEADNTDHKGLGIIKQACTELGLELKMAHSGHGHDVKPHETMPDFYRSIDCLAIASVSEGCNNPTLEALAMNKPVISTDVGIASELEGVTLVKRDVKSIKTALRHLSGRIQIAESYTWDKVAQEYYHLYTHYLPQS